MEPRIEMVAGLGNPGRRYANTRHNAGFMVADRLVERLGGASWQRVRHSLEATAYAGGERVLVLKPQTYMNLSGRAVQAALAFYGLRAQQCLVVYDDVDLPLGRLRLRLSGNSGGHRGLQSIIDHLGTSAVPRLRVGVGRPPPELETADYVLQPFAPDERQPAWAAVERATDAALCALREGMEAAMRRFNGAGASDVPHGTQPY